ncbi:MAG: hypothetical protein J7M21_06300 [Planctomycetes bacterium]|nr:hypothetical protein [Planctomycetota bacterium]
MTGMMTTGGALRRFFAGLVESAFFQQLGIADVGLGEYVSDLLFRFVRMDAVFALRDARGRRLEEVGEMLAEAEDRSVAAHYRRAVHKHIGDFVLFWTGLYPEFLRYLRGPWRKDSLLDYMNQARRSYRIAAETTSPRSPEESRTLRLISEELELCVFGLHLVRRGWQEQWPEGLRRFRPH